MGPEKRVIREVSMVKLNKGVVMALAFACVGSAASAASFTFTLNNSGDEIDPISANSFSIDQTIDGITLTGTFSGMYIDDGAFTGDTLASGTVTDAASLTRYYTGAGVCGAGPCYGTDTRHTVDGVSDGSADFDFIEMAFTTTSGPIDVTLTELVFGYVGRFPYGGRTYGYEGTNGSFEVITDAFSDDGAIGIGDLRAYSGDAPQVYRNGAVDLSGVTGLTDSIFGVKAGENGSWKLLSATVNFSAPVVIEEIPLPASAWMLLAGIVGVAWAGRRRP